MSAIAAKAASWLTEPIQPVAQFIEGALALRPYRMSEDMPLATCLYPHFICEGGAVRVMDNDTQRGGMRWGYSSAWDGETPHYFLPDEVLLAQPPTRPLYMTAAHHFDFLYAPERTREVVERTFWYRKAVKAGLRVEFVRRGDERLFPLFQVATANVEFWPFYRSRYQEMIRFLPDSSLSPFVLVYGLFTKENMLVGYQIAWLETQRCAFLVHRWVLSEWKWATRFLIGQIAGDMIGVVPVLNDADAHGLPGLAQFKMSLGPMAFKPYYNVLEREEVRDWLQSRTVPTAAN